MTLKSKTFLIGKGESLVGVSEFLKQEIGYDAYLVKDIQAESVNELTTQLTILYNKYSDRITDSIAPRIGGIYTSGIVGADFDARFVFEHPIDPSTIESGSFIVDLTGLNTDKVTLLTGYNNYFAKINLTGYSAEQFHEFRIDTNKINRVDGSQFSYSPVGGYVIHNQSSAHLGDYSRDYLSRRRGVVKLDVVRSSKGSDFQKVISESLSVKGISSDNLINFSITQRSNNLLDIFYLYISSSEPQILEGFPLNYSLFPDVASPAYLTLVFNVPLDSSQIRTVSCFSIHSGYNTEEDISVSDIELLDDKKTVRISLSSYLVEQKIYSILVKPGLKSQAGFIKQKPEQWVLHVNRYEGGGSTSTGTSSGVTDHGLLNGLEDDDHGLYLTTGRANTWLPTSPPWTGHTGDPTIHYTQESISITESQISDFGSYTNLSLFTGHTGQTSIHFTVGSINHDDIQNNGSYLHEDIDTHIDSISNPHSVTASQVGAPTLAQFTGHTGAADPHTNYVLANGTRPFTATIAGVDPVGLSDLATAQWVIGSFVLGAVYDAHTGDLNNPHQVTASQVGAPTTALFTGHTGDTSIHYSMGSISITESQITDLQIYTLPDGSRPFTGTISGVTPVSSAHLATKGYVDSVISPIDVDENVQFGISAATHGYTLTGGTGIYLDDSMSGFLFIHNTLLDIADLSFSELILEAGSIPSAPTGDAFKLYSYTTGSSPNKSTYLYVMDKNGDQIILSSVLE